MTRLLSGVDQTARAAGELEGAARETGTADALADAAAAWLVLGLESEDGEPLVRALDLAERAVEKEAENLPGLFNRSLALQFVGLTKGAIKSWQVFLKHEPDPAWRAEAASRLRALMARTSARDRTGIESCPYRHDELLRWDLVATIDAPVAHSKRPVRSESSEQDMFESCAAELQAQAGDPYFAHLKTWLRQVSREQRRREVARAALIEFREAMRAYDVRSTESANLLGRSRERLDGLESPLAHAATVHLATSTRWLGGAANLDTAARAAEDACPTLRQAGYVWLAGKCHWSLATTRFQQADLHESNEQYLRALEDFRSALDPDSAVVVSALLAEGLVESGRPGEAWNLILQALEEVGGVSDRRRYSVHQQAARMALATEQPGAARWLQKEALVAAIRTGQPYLTSDVMMGQAKTEAGLGHLERALEALRSAEEELASIEDVALRESALAMLGLTFGSLGSEIDPSVRIEASSRANSIFSQRINIPYSARALVHRSKAYRDAGASESAGEDLEAALHFVESFGSSLPDASSRSMIFDHHDLYDAAIELLLEDGQHERALLLAERELFFSYQRGSGATSPNSGSLLELRERLGSHGVLMLRVVGKNLVGWTLTKSGIAMAIKTPFQDVRWAHSVLARSPADVDGVQWHRASEQFHRLLIAESGLEPQALEELTIIADGYVGNLPFAGLRDPVTERYLAEEVAVVRAPSIFLSVIGDSRGAHPASFDFLAMGDPAFAEEAPGLARLAAARREAQLVADTVGGSGAVLLAEQATPGEMKKGLATARVVHYAGHALANVRHPWKSSLLLSPSQDARNGRLTAESLLGMPMVSDLVVLSACDSATSLSLGVGGAGVGLTLPFLVGGVPDVIGSLAPVSDDAALRFFEIFYGEYVHSGDTLVAFRNAQIEASRLDEVGPAAFYFSLNRLLQTQEERP